MPRNLFGWINWIVAAMFLLSVILQYNDPDPLLWILIYGAATAACLGAGKPWGRWLAAGLGVGCLIWAATMAPRVLPDLQLGHLIKKMQAKTPQIEEGREMLGLVLIAGWMAVLVGWSRLSSSRSS